MSEGEEEGVSASDFQRSATRLERGWMVAGRELQSRGGGLSSTAEEEKSSTGPSSRSFRSEASGSPASRDCETVAYELVAQTSCDKLHEQVLLEPKCLPEQRHQEPGMKTNRWCQRRSGGSGRSCQRLPPREEKAG